jgi:ribosome-binding factor A
MKKTRRTSRVGENIRDALVEVFRHDLKGIQVGFASINEVEVSPDFSFAKVYMTGLNEDEAKDTVAALQKARAKIRHFLGQRIHLRYTPELDFRYDETAMRANRIETILREVLPPAAVREEPAEDESDEGDGSEDEATRE